MKDELREAAEKEARELVARLIVERPKDNWRSDLDEADLYAATAMYVAGYEAGKPKWIPVGERLPDIEGWYSVYGLVYLNVPPIVTTALYENGRWSAAGEPAYILVVAWQPLPEPYTEGE